MKSEKGQAMVEFALVLPVLALLLFGIVDFGRIFYTKLTLEQASREAARVAIVGADNNKICQKAIAASSVSLTCNNVHLYPTEKTNRTEGSDVTITITYSISFITPLVNQFTGPLSLQSQTVMRME